MIIRFIACCWPLDYMLTGFNLWKGVLYTKIFQLDKCVAQLVFNLHILNLIAELPIIVY